MNSSNIIRHISGSSDDSLNGIINDFTANNDYRLLPEILNIIQTSISNGTIISAIDSLGLHSMYLAEILILDQQNAASEIERVEAVELAFYALSSVLEQESRLSIEDRVAFHLDLFILLQSYKDVLCDILSKIISKGDTGDEQAIPTNQKTEYICSIIEQILYNSVRIIRPFVKSVGLSEEDRIAFEYLFFKGNTLRWHMLDNIATLRTLICTEVKSKYC